MSAEVSTKVSILTSMGETITSLLAAVDKSRQPSVELGEISSLLTRFDSALLGAKLDAQGVKDAAKKSECIASLRGHKEHLKDLRASYESKQVSAARKGLLDGAKASSASGASASAASRASASGMMSHGLAVQDQSTASLMRTLAMIGEAKSLGASTNHKLAEQTEQVARVAGKLEEVDTTLDRTVKTIKRIQRRE